MDFLSVPFPPLELCEQYDSPAAHFDCWNSDPFTLRYSSTLERTCFLTIFKDFTREQVANASYAHLRVVNMSADRSPAASAGMLHTNRDAKLSLPVCAILPLDTERNFSLLENAPINSSSDSSYIYPIFSARPLRLIHLHRPRASTLRTTCNAL